MNKPKVLIICTGNSMRSQMGEALLRADLGEWIDVYSAGTHPSYVHPLTIAALDEIGLDTSCLRSKSVTEFLDTEMDLVITVCDHAREACPVFQHAEKIVHCGYPDPIAIRPGEDRGRAFAALRDQMREELRALVIEELNLPVPPSA